MGGALTPPILSGGGGTLRLGMSSKGLNAEMIGCTALTRSSTGQSDTLGQEHRCPAGRPERAFGQPCYSGGRKQISKAEFMARLKTLRRLLVVGNSPNIAQRARELLVKDGYRPADLEVVTTLRHAREALAAAEWDAVLLELDLPDSRGLDTLRAILVADDALPVVALTDHADRELAVAALAEGTQDFVVTTDLSASSMGRILEDAVARKTAEKRLKRSEARYRLLTEHALDLIWMMSPDLEFTYVSPAITALSGYTPEEVVGTRLAQYVAPHDFEALLAIVAEELARYPEDRGVIASTTLIAKDGEQVPVEVHAKFVRDEDGAPVALHGIARNISERNRAETERRLLQAQLAHAQRMESIGRLASGVAHDFNNLLQALTGTIQALRRRGADASDFESDLAHLDLLVERGSRLTRQLLMFSRRDAERPIALDLNRLLSHNANMLRRLLPETIEIQHELCDQPLGIMIDPGRIEQVVVNLAVNAADAMPVHGRLTFRTGADHGSALLEVEDTGTGIPDDLHDKVFDPFFTTKEAGTGTGLGLSVVRGIVTEAGGTIDLGTTPAGGTMFTVRLPLLDAKGQLTPVPGTGGIVRGRGERVLVVDDDENVRTGIEQMLKLLGYHVVAADGRQGALAAVAEGSFGLLLTDMVLADGSGIEIATELQSHQPGLPVVLMSGYSPEIADSGSLLERSFLQKPFTLELLAQAVRAALDEGAAGDEGC